MADQKENTPGVVSMTYFTFYHEQHSRALCNEFWRDPHAMVAARGKGANLYRQHHFDPDKVDVWPRIDGVSHEMPTEWMPDGIDELVMEDPSLITPAAAAMFMADEQNFLRRGLIYASPKGQYLWRRYDNSPLTSDGKMAGQRIYVFLRRRDGISQSDFAEFIQNHLITAIIGSDDIREARSYIFAPYDETAWPSPGLAHDHPTEQQYHGAILLSGDSELAIARMFQSKAFQSTLARQAEIFESVCSVGVESSYNMVDEVKPTLTGLRGYTCARIISQIGAVNHTEDPLLSDVVTVSG